MDKTIMRKFNIYCDESSVENNLPYFVIGALLIPREQKSKITSSLRQIKINHEFSGKEIKWNKVTQKYFDFYKEIIDYCIENTDVEFKSIIVDKSIIDMTFHAHNNELMFYKFYYQVLKYRFKNDSINYIFTDYKERKQKLRLDEMKKYLSRFQDIRSTNVQIKHLQEYDSHEIELLQLADFFTGIVAYANNFNEDKHSAKRKLVNYIERKLSIDLSEGTNLYFEKFNIFKWKPNNHK